MRESPGVVSASEAAITTVSVEVRAIRIGTKQMTQSVFKQLREERLIDRETLELRGTPWGWVNYHHDCGDLYSGHLHVVWQSGSELRSCVLEEGGGYASVPAQQAIRNAEGWVYRWLAIRALEGWKPERHGYRDCFRYAPDLQVELSSDLTAFWGYLPNERYREKVVALAGEGYSLDEVQANLDGWLERYRAALGKWKQLYQQVKEAGQLFIAV